MVKVLLVCWRILLYPDNASLPKLGMDNKIAENTSADIRKLESTKSHRYLKNCTKSRRQSEASVEDQGGTAAP